MFSRLLVLTIGFLAATIHGNARADFVFSAEQLFTQDPAPTGQYSFDIFLESTRGDVDILGYQFDLDAFALGFQAGEDSYLSFDFAVDGNVSSAPFGTSTSNTNIGILNANLFTTLHSLSDTPTLLGTLNIEVVNSFSGVLSLPFDPDAAGTSINLVGGGSATGDELVFLGGPSITAIPEPSCVLVLGFLATSTFCIRRPRRRSATFA